MKFVYLTRGGLGGDEVGGEAVLDGEAVDGGLDLSVLDHVVDVLRRRKLRHRHLYLHCVALARRRRRNLNLGNLSFINYLEDRN